MAMWPATRYVPTLRAVIGSATGVSIVVAGGLPPVGHTGHRGGRDHDHRGFEQRRSAKTESAAL